MPVQPEQKLSEKDIYKDEETLLLYFRDDKDNVYCLDLDTKAIYFCCHTKMTFIKNMTKEQKRKKREVAD